MFNRPALRVVLVCLIAPLFTAQMGGSAQASGPVYVVSIEGMIDLGLAPFLSRLLREAEEAGAAAVLLEINT